MNLRRNLLLNSSFFRNRVAELGLKQWWLAEQVGVDRKTVIRWLQGKVKSIQSENAEQLAKILECPLSSLCLDDEADHIATPEDQKIAGQLLASASLIEKLGPIGEWNVIESLLKATAVPQLPKSVLGEMYNQLTVASWRQSKIAQAELYNQKALDIAAAIGDRKIKTKALLSRGNIFSWRGKSKQAIETYEQCLSEKSFISPKTIGSIYSNLGAVLYEAGDLERGLFFQEKAIEEFLIHGQPMNFSIAYCHKAMICLQMKLFDTAQEACERSVRFAEKGDYRRGIQMAALIRAELAARNGNSFEAEREVRSALEGFEALGISEGLNFEFAGRVFRILEKWKSAETYVRRGIEISTEFPMYLAALYFELAKILARSEVSPADVSAARDKAIAVYLDCEAPIRAGMVKNYFETDS